MASTSVAIKLLDGLYTRCTKVLKTCLGVQSLSLGMEMHHRPILPEPIS